MNKRVGAVLWVGLIAGLAGCTDSSQDDAGIDGADDTTGITTMPTTTTTTGGDGDGDATGDGDGDTASGDGDGDGMTGDGDGDPSCGEVEIFPEYVPPNVMLVVDASGSMVSQSWDHDLDDQTPDVTRWSSLHGVVQSVMDQFGQAMYAGIQRFPAEAACDPDPCYNLTSCTTEAVPEVGVALDNAGAVLAAIPGAGAGSDEVEGGTPATKGIVSAIDHLDMQEQGLGNYILLVTDGAANCNTTLEHPDYIEQYDETLPTTVQDASDNHDITTFVVGIDIIDQLVGQGQDGAPEANAFERLNDVAVAGGAPKNGGNEAEKFFNATNQQELLDALSIILGEVTDCIIDLSDNPPQPNQIEHVKFFRDDMEVPQVKDCSTEDGWV